MPGEYKVGSRAERYDAGSDARQDVSQCGGGLDAHREECDRCGVARQASVVATREPNGAQPTPRAT